MTLPHYENQRSRNSSSLTGEVPCLGTQSGELEEADFRLTSLIAILYFVVITGVELINNYFNMQLSFVLHVILFTILVFHAARSGQPATYKLLLSLTLVPLTRIMSLAMPLTGFSAIYWYLIIYPPLFLGGWIAMRHLDISRKEVGLTLKKPLIQIMVMFTGFALGAAEYAILKPEPVIPLVSTGSILLSIFVFTAGTGFVEEFIFRGVIQKASVEALGNWGLLFTAAIFAVLHVIHNSPIDVFFVFIVGLFFGIVVKRTGSLVGVTLAHGITNTLLYVVFPLLT